MITGNCEKELSTQMPRRVKNACEPCRFRKRRCDGSAPCRACKQFKDKCRYQKHPRKRSKLVDEDAVRKGIVQRWPEAMELPSQTSRADTSKMKSMEANSGIEFTRLLGTELEASAALKLSTFGWNLGISSTIAPTIEPITDFLTYDQVIAVSQSFFAIVHPIYGIFDQEWFMKEVMLRFSADRPNQCPDHLMAGVAALGILFSNGDLHGKLQGLIDSAKLALERTDKSQPPTLFDVQSWILRTIYLRATGHPHACWLASNIAMHLVEACSLQREPEDPSACTPSEDYTIDLEIKRRTFWVARMLNTWVSFDCGHCQVDLRGSTSKLPAYREGDFTRKYIDLYNISCCLDPNLLDKSDDLEELLCRLEHYDAPHDCIQLSRANLALCTYRRLRLRNSNLSNTTISRVLDIGIAGLQAAQKVADEAMPWWHVANVPFQFICIALAIDSRQSLTLIGRAIRTLELVVNRFDTIALNESLRTAFCLVELSKRKKTKDSDVLTQSVELHTMGISSKVKKLESTLPYAEEISLQHLRQQSPPNPDWQGEQSQPSTAEADGLQHMAWIRGRTESTHVQDWSTDNVESAEIDWDYFLGTESNRLW